VVATTSSTEDPRPYLFRNYSYKGETLGTSECHVWEAGLATAAAHTYFPVVEIGMHRPLPWRCVRVRVRARY
jgi:hypothetical protein